MANHDFYRPFDHAGWSRIPRWSHRPEPFKYIHFPTRDEVGLEIAVSPGASADSSRVTLSTKRPIKGIILDVEGDADAHWSDQAVDLVPEDPQTVDVKGLAGRKVLARYLGDGTA